MGLNIGLPMGFYHSVLGAAVKLSSYLDATSSSRLTPRL